MTEEDIAALTSAVQQAFDARAPLMASQVLPVAENMSDSGNQVLIDTLNSPVEGMEEAAARTMMSINKDNSRVLTSAPQLASSREALYNILVSGYSAQSGDLLYTYGPGLGDLITGHGAIWNNNNASFLTADVPEGEKITGAKTTYYSAKHQTINKVNDTAMKLLHVNSPKTEGERYAAIEAAYNKYNGRKYMIQLIKSYDSSSLYCTQLAWLTWMSMGVDIDGTWAPTSFFVQNLVKQTVPVSIVVGNSSTTIYVTTFVLVVTLLTMDIIYPWDMVIDNDTSEYARFGKENPGN